MAEISDRIRPRINSLEPALRDAILAKDRDIRNLQDLIGVMTEVIQEAEEAQNT